MVPPSALVDYSSSPEALACPLALPLLWPASGPRIGVVLGGRGGHCPGVAWASCRGAALPRRPMPRPAAVNVSWARGLWPSRPGFSSPSFTPQTVLLRPVYRAHSRSPPLGHGSCLASVLPGLPRAPPAPHAKVLWPMYSLLDTLRC